MCCVCVLYLCQCLYAGVNVTTSHLRDDKVDGGGRAVVEVIKVWRDRTHPWNTKIQVTLNIWIISVFLPLYFLSELWNTTRLTKSECAYLGSGIMMGSSSSSSLCWTRSGISHTLLWSISIMSKSNWNSLGMDGWEASLSWAFCRAWLGGRTDGGGGVGRDRTVYLVQRIIDQCLLTPVLSDTSFYLLLDWLIYDSIWLYPIVIILMCISLVQECQ